MIRFGNFGRQIDRISFEIKEILRQISFGNINLRNFLDKFVKFNQQTIQKFILTIEVMDIFMAQTVTLSLKFDPSPSKCFQNKTKYLQHDFPRFSFLSILNKAA